MNYLQSTRGQTHVGVVWILGALATWSAALSISMFNDHAALAGVAQQIADIKDSIDNRVIPALSAPITHISYPKYTYASTTISGE